MVHIAHRALSASYFGLDATSIPVLDIQHPLGLRTGALWLLQGDHCYSYFLYATSGHAHHLEAKLKGYKLASVMWIGQVFAPCCPGLSPASRRRSLESLAMPPSFAWLAFGRNGGDHAAGFRARTPLAEGLRG